MFLLVLFLALANALIRFEEAANAGPGGGEKPPVWFVWMVLGIGVLAGSGFMTRYGFGLVIVPVAVSRLVRGRFRGRAMFFAAGVPVGEYTLVGSESSP